MPCFSRALRLRASVQLDLAALCTALILLQVTADALMRRLFNAPIPAGNENVAYDYTVGLTFLPLMTV